MYIQWNGIKWTRTYGFVRFGTQWTNSSVIRWQCTSLCTMHIYLKFRKIAIKKEQQQWQQQWINIELHLSDELGLSYNQTELIGVLHFIDYTQLPKSVHWKGFPFVKAKLYNAIILFTVDTNHSGDKCSYLLLCTVYTLSCFLTNFFSDASHLDDQFFNTYQYMHVYMLRYGKRRNTACAGWSLSYLFSCACSSEFMHAMYNLNTLSLLLCTQSATKKKEKWKIKKKWIQRGLAASSTRIQYT